jgi:hypothetical protein
MLQAMSTLASLNKEIIDENEMLIQRTINSSLNRDEQPEGNEALKLRTDIVLLKALRLSHSMA